MNDIPTKEQLSEEIASILNNAVGMQNTVSQSEMIQMASTIRQSIAANPHLQRFIDESLGADRPSDWVETILKSMVTVSE